MTEVERYTAIADQVVPEYRRRGSNYSCSGVVARRWQAAWYGACIALGGNPADHIVKLDVRANTQWIENPS